MSLSRIYLNAWGLAANPKELKLRERYAPCCTDLHVTVNSASDTKWKPFRSMSDWVETAKHVNDLGLRLHPMVWARPDLEYQLRMVDWLAELQERAGFDTVLLDAESAWSKGFPKGERPSQRSVREEVWALRAADLHMLLTMHGLEYDVTDVPMVDWKVVGPLFRGARRAFVQTHEFARTTSSIRKPGRLIKWTYDVWPQRLQDTCALLVPHLAAYHYGTKQTADGLRASIEAAVARRATAIGAWTSRSFYGAPLRQVLAEYKGRITAPEKERPEGQECV